MRLTMKREMVLALMLTWWLAACSTHGSILPRLSVDSIQVREFSIRVTNRYQNYADLSGYNHYADSIDAAKRNSLRIGSCRDSIDVGFIVVPSNRRIFLYTFDKKDSCILCPSIQDQKMYFLSTQTLAIPSGNYEIVHDTTSMPFHHPDLQ
jgi:hypothetical protein